MFAVEVVLEQSSDQCSISGIVGRSDRGIDQGIGEGEGIERGTLLIKERNNIILF
jgi:hypothetical protein